jgi:hypothetical protein
VITKRIQEELTYYIGHNREVAGQNREAPEEGNGDGSDYEEVAVAFEAVLGGTVLTEMSERQREVLQAELIQLSDRYEGKEGREWENLMAAYGALQEWDANTIYSKRPRTRVINGIRYIVG